MARMKIQNLVNICTDDDSRAYRSANRPVSPEITIPNLRARLSIEDARKLGEALLEACQIVAPAAITKWTRVVCVECTVLAPGHDADCSIASRLMPWCNFCRCWHHLTAEHIQPMGQCEFCMAPKVSLVAMLAADPDQRVCRVCHDDPRIPTIAPSEVEASAK